MGADVILKCLSCKFYYWYVGILEAVLMGIEDLQIFLEAVLKGIEDLQIFPESDVHFFILDCSLEFFDLRVLIQKHFCDVE